MMFTGSGLSGVTVVVGNDCLSLRSLPSLCASLTSVSAQPLFPLNLAFSRWAETGAKNLVPNIHTLMRSLFVVVVRQPHLHFRPIAVSDRSSLIR
jgi:hypothetical protein